MTLEELNLDHNKLRSIPMSICGLTNLREVRLRRPASAPAEREEKGEKVDHAGQSLCCKINEASVCLYVRPHRPRLAGIARQARGPSGPAAMFLSPIFP